MNTKISVNNIEALINAMELKLAEDERVVLYGQDVGVEGGVFRATQGLQAKFGADRVWDSPISEAAQSGVAVGAALHGLLPIAEIQFSGFAYPTFMQMAGHAARFRSRTRGRFSVPMVLRMPMGGQVRAPEHHSENIEAMFAHIPGLKVVIPSNPYDTKGLMIAAIEDPDPVVFLEPKRIYRSFKQEIPAGKYTVPIGKANIILPGTDLTLITYGASVMETINALKLLKEQKFEGSVELIDLRTISPMDYETILESFKKTGRLLVVHEAVKAFSVSAEILAKVSEDALEYAKAPLMRLTGWDIVVPQAQNEKYQYVNPERIADAIKKILKFEF